MLDNEQNQFLSPNLFLLEDTQNMHVNGWFFQND